MTFLRPRPTARPELRLVVLHHAGGSAASYSPLARWLPVSWEVLLLDLPGRGVRSHEPLRTDARELAELVATDFRDTAVDRDVPFALFGHSMGAMLAAETAARLCAEGTAPAWIGLSGRLAPGVRVPTSGRPVRLHELDDADLLAALSTLGGIPAELFELPGFLRRFLATARADLTAVGTYDRTPGSLSIGCPVSVFGGLADPWAPPGLLRHWRSCAGADYTQTLFPGGHFYLAADGYATLAATLQSHLSAVLHGSSRGAECMSGPLIHPFGPSPLERTA